MSHDSQTLTNVLLVAVLVLLLVSLAVPIARDEPPGPVEPAAPSRDSHDAEIADLVARVELLLRRAPEMAPAPDRPGSDDEIVVRIPGKIARELGITAADVRTVVEGLARVARQAAPRRPLSNETAAVATSRNCCSAQGQFQATAKADVDRDGTGEFGTFVELSGARAVRGNPDVGVMNPPVLSGAFRNPSERGFVSRSGYLFIIYLPDASGDGVAPDAAGYDRVDPDQAETHWCMYSWPVQYGVSGRMTYMVNQAGDVVATDAKEYSGFEGAPLPGAAFASGGRYSITGTAAIGRQGQDGHDWKQVN